MPTIELAVVDYLILAVYFVFVLGIGWALKRHIKTSSDFFLCGRSIPAWVAGLAFLSANLGAQEVIGMAASGAKYGIMTSHFYWVGAIPAMVFVGVFMMPFYYGSKARSVPEYLKLRFDEKTRAFNAISFAVMTVFSSGISMHVLARLLEQVLGFNYHLCIVVSAFIVLIYIFLGGLTSAIYNEVVQFFLIVFGFAPLVFLGLQSAGGWDGLVTKLNVVATSPSNPAGRALAEGAWTQSWAHMGSPTDNPMGVEWFGMVFGLGFVLSFGYWCTDFLVVQRAMAAHSMGAAPHPVDRGGSQDAVSGSGHPARHDRHRAASDGGRFSAHQRQRRGGLQHDDPDDARPLLPARPAGDWHHRADGLVHVGHGRQRDSLQYRVDL